MWDELFSFVCLSLLSPRELRFYHWEQQLCMPHISMDTIIDSSNEFDTYACVSLHISFISLTCSNHSPPALSVQQPARLGWRIWVILITKGLLDTGAPSVNTTQLDAQMRTPKVFCAWTSGWNQWVKMAWYRNISWPVWNMYVLFQCHCLGQNSGIFIPGSYFYILVSKWPQLPAYRLSRQ